jgi:hypothetical protein
MRIVVDLVSHLYFVCSNSLADFLPFGAGTITLGCLKYHTLLAGIWTGAEVRDEGKIPYPEGIADRDVRLCQWKDLDLDMPKNQTDVSSSYSFISSYGPNIQNSACAATIFVVRSCPHSGPFHAVELPPALLAHDDM